MSDRIEALLGLHARRSLTHHQLIAALTLAGVSDPERAIAAPTLVDLPPAVHIARSPLLRARQWNPQPADTQDDSRLWGRGTQL